jgi:branched-chain amino acid transport system substrate-binding protein
MRASFLSPLVVAAATAALAAGCGGTSEAAVRIGVLADCTGAFASFRDLELATAELPLLDRGAHLVGQHPSDGVSSVRVGGRRVEFVPGCGEWGKYRVLIAEARRLIEKEHVDVLIASLGDSDGVVVREIARRHPDVTFLLTESRAQATTLRQPAANLFRFQPDGAQESAGLGSYAYRSLGWRTAAVVSDDIATTWDRVAGFVAEFCALGGRVVSRTWLPSGPPIPAALARKIPAADGVALVIGNPFIDWSAFVRVYAHRHAPAARHLVFGPETVILRERRAAAARLAPGVVAADFAPYASRNRVWLRLQRGFARRFPGLPALTSPAEFPLGIASYDAMEATLEALEFGRGRQLRAALASLELQTPTGPIRLDKRRQAVAPNYLTRIDRRAGGRPVARVVRTVSGVEETFNGYFTPSTAPPSHTSPECRRAAPPRWASAG